MEKHLKNGFTLIELMVALAVAAILLGVGIPSFSSAIQNSRISANYNALAQALYIARSEAVKSSDNITVCPRAPGETDACGEDWNNGVLVFSDQQPLSSGITGTFGLEDTLLHTQQEFRDGSTIFAMASNNRTETDAGKVKLLRYLPEGRTTWANGYFAVCDDDRGETSSKSLNIVLTGDIRRGRPTAADDKTPINVFGTPLQCD